ncbi:glycosyltransferase [Alkalihalobacillus sp. AL-G]|uniref:glycosyltransferase family 2 protein n=1 Tax=Alkalihalobacillus sp. AL-G TaxID=2926399 RepID=UPI00272A1351|nr:glycosyltransferase [Alkalihalobacillus sp. AL-G]WLD94978.1 glycosyltransferase [Alkalihalobacillus sp. AL-G]
MLISVVMPVYNGELYLQEAIDSILQQTYRSFEFVIVNDGSTDKTSRILEAIQDPRVRTIHLNENQGAAAALNIAIETTKGHWITTQDADDISLPTRLEEQAYYVQKYPEIAAVGTLKQCIGGKTPISKRRLRTEELGNFLVSSDHLKKYRFYVNPLCHGSVLYSKDVYDKVGGYDPDYKICHDYDLWMKMFEVGSIHKISKVLYQYRIHSESLSRVTQSYNEDWVVATTYIKKTSQEFRGFQHEPLYIVLGNKEACNEFKQVCLITHMKVHRYIHCIEPDTANEIYRLFMSNTIDGVILLEGIQYNSTIQELQSKGMELNKSLFKIWAGYWN